MCVALPGCCAGSQATAIARVPTVLLVIPGFSLRVALSSAMELDSADSKAMMYRTQLTPEMVVAATGAVIGAVSSSLGSSSRSRATALESLRCVVVS